MEVWLILVNHKDNQLDKIETTACEESGNIVAFFFFFFFNRQCANVSSHTPWASTVSLPLPTALLNIHNDILSSMDDGKVTALTLLDLSAAFDTIDHTMLLRRLDDWFGVSGKALDWFKSYLTGRSQRIKLGNCLSSNSDLSFGVPQGSVLSPLLLHYIPLHSVARFRGILSHIISMLMIASRFWFFSPRNSAAALNGLQSCLASVQSWMSTNKLKLNQDKTEFPLIGNERQWSKYRSVSNRASKC